MEHLINLAKAAITEKNYRIECLEHKRDNLDKEIKEISDEIDGLSGELEILKNSYTTN